jgi:hypothetical protein
VTGIGYQRQRVCQDPIDCFENDKAEIEDRTDGEGSSDIFGFMRVAGSVRVCIVVMTVI